MATNSFKLICLSLFLFGIGAFAEFNLDEGVLVLSNTDFKKAVESYEHILVEFYAPWCGHCKQLAPEYAKAAKSLTEEGSAIKLAKVDATEEKELAEQYGIRGYPTLKFFINGKPIDYGGGRQADTIISWLKKKTGPPALVLNTVDEYETFSKNSTVAIVGVFKDAESEFAKKFLSVATMVDDFPFAISHAEEVISHAEADSEGKIILHKTFDEGKVVYEGAASEDAIKTFVSAHSLPLVVEFNHETAAKIFGGDVKSHLLLFLSQKAGHFDTFAENAKKVAKDFREQVLFVTINADEDDHVRILEFFGMKKDDVPSMRAIKLEEDMAKFKPESDEMDEETIRKFVSEFVTGNVKQHYLSQELPENWDAEPVKVLVASNFEKIVKDENKKVLVEFYAPWCGHCKQLAPIYDQLAEKYKDDDSVVVAKIDATANELENVKVSSFPTISLYLKDKTKVIEYNGERTLDGLSKFIDTDGEYGKSPEPASAEEEEEEEGEDEEPEEGKEEAPRDEL